VKAVVCVRLKPDVLDPQGRAIQRAAATLGYSAIADVRQGKLFEIALATADRAAAERLVRELCDKLLANSVIEDWSIERIE
jgi:phosphoribosylformylglycinamidine synthase